MCATTIQPEQRLVLTGISWEQYEKLLDALGDRGLRHCYDGWELEMMSPSLYHEKVKRLLGRLIDMASFELVMPIASAGSTTMRRQAQQKGIEPDEAYFIANEPRIRGKLEWDAERDPPPDLALEVDVWSSSERRMLTYHALGVPEVWRFVDDQLAFFRRGPQQYEEITQSLAFPFLTAADLMPYVTRMETTDETTLMRSFVDWLRAHPVVVANRKAN